ncbi:type IV conjugative transfer system protein TraL [Chlamydiales bacterium]|nr:type IV conjugative transfer system protein TraL [Chlamydiales bacterium]
MDKKLLRTLDRPPKHLFWESDELMLFTLIVVVVMMVNPSLPYLLIGTVISAFFVYRYKKIKGVENGVSLSALFYWYLPVKSGKKNALPPSHIRELLL